MFVVTPRIRNSATARRPRHRRLEVAAPAVSLASSESKCAVTSAPVYVVPPSSRTPSRPGAVGGDLAGVGPEPLAGSSVVIRHCIAAPACRSRPGQSPGRPGSRRRDPHLGLDEVDAGDLLGHRVLDLDPRVHLDEEVVAGRVDQELDGARRSGSRSRWRSAPRRRTSASRSSGSRCGAGAISTTFWWRRCTEQSRSYRWITLPRLCEDLHLDVRGSTTACSMKTVGSPKAPSASRMRSRPRPQVLGVVDAAHAAAAAARDRLDEQRDSSSLAARRGCRRRCPARRWPGSGRRPPWPPRPPAPCCRSA